MRTLKFMEAEAFTHRRNLLPLLARKLKAKSYLEIGVKGGKTFLPIRVRKKYAVDPNFTIKAAYKKSQIWKYPFNMFAKYFPCTSDEFFEKHCEHTIKKSTLDLAFIDGLHTYEQTYKDIENTLPLLKSSGVILVHDCSPKSAAAACPANSIDEVKKNPPPGFDGLWSGDVWKIIPRLTKEHPELDVFVIDHDSGLGIISKSNLFDDEHTPKFDQLDYSIDDIDGWDYDHMDKNRKNIIKTVNPEYLKTYCLLFN